jgi:predicted nucleic acid-binding protein
MGIKDNFCKALLLHNRMFLDSSILIYHLEGAKPYSTLTTELFTILAEGKLECILSTISITELLTKPFKENKKQQIRAFENFINSLPNTLIIPPTYSIAKRAAKLRSQYNWRIPDAVLSSTALEEKCGVFLTNDNHFIKLKNEDISVIILAEFIETF